MAQFGNIMVIIMDLYPIPQVHPPPNQLCRNEKQPFACSTSVEKVKCEKGMVEKRMRLVLFKLCYH